jgi:polyhydroxybutyrate depolymerase
MSPRNQIGGRRHAVRLPRSRALLPLFLPFATVLFSHATALPVAFDSAGRHETHSVPADSAGVERARIFVGHVERTFLHHAPATLPAAPALVLVFHGAGGDGARVRSFLGDQLERFADAHGFVVIYADGVGGHWNDCRVNAPYPAKKRNIDDLTFVRAMIRWSEGRYGVDASKVRAIGFSNGGHFALRLALEMPDDIEAIAALGAALPVDHELDCTVGRRTSSILLINGTADSVNPFDGGDASVNGVRLGGVRSSLQSAHDLARIAGHRNQPEHAVILPPRDDGSGIERIRWRARGRPSVALVTVHGAGHTVPGSQASFPEWLGRVERAYSAVGEAVRFFSTTEPMHRTRWEPR